MLRTTTARILTSMQGLCPCMHGKKKEAHAFKIEDLNSEALDCNPKGYHDQGLLKSVRSRILNALACKGETLNCNPSGYLGFPKKAHRKQSLLKSVLLKYLQLSLIRETNKHGF